jgi:nicotinamidase-related amidase
MDICVPATELDAIDYGYCVIIGRDVVCSSSDERHDTLLKLYHQRYSEQVETADLDDVLSRWS